LAEHIVPFTETIDEIDDLLTLKGLKLLHERNS
jgi:type III pantothenate kinase